MIYLWAGLVVLAAGLALLFLEVRRLRRDLGVDSLRPAMKPPDRALSTKRLFEDPNGGEPFVGRGRKRKPDEEWVDGNWPWDKGGPRYDE